MNKKKNKRNSLFGKVIILLTLSFGIKLFFSCTPSSPIPIEINYNTISAVGVDNSGRFVDYYSTIDTIYSDAIALKLTLSDSNMFYASSYSPNILQSFSFHTMHAESIEPYYIPKNKVIGIKIKTLLDINETIKAGEDISAHILCSKRENFGMYNNLSHGISWLNGVQNYESSAIVLVLKTSVKNTNAQFEVVVTFDSGDSLLCTTEIFTIIES